MIYFFTILNSCKGFIESYRKFTRSTIPNFKFFTFCGINYCTNFVIKKLCSIFCLTHSTNTAISVGFNFPEGGIS